MKFKLFNINIEKDIIIQIYICFLSDIKCSDYSLEYVESFNDNYLSKIICQEIEKQFIYNFEHIGILQFDKNIEKILFFLKLSVPSESYKLIITFFKEKYISRYKDEVKNQDFKIEYSNKNLNINDKISHTQVGINYVGDTISILSNISLQDNNSSNKLQDTAFEVDFIDNKLLQKVNDNILKEEVAISTNIKTAIKMKDFMLENIKYDILNSNNKKFEPFYSYKDIDIQIKIIQNTLSTFKKTIVCYERDFKFYLESSLTNNYIFNLFNLLIEQNNENHINKLFEVFTVLKPIENILVNTSLLEFFVYSYLLNMSIEKCFGCNCFKEFRFNNKNETFQNRKKRLKKILLKNDIIINNTIINNKVYDFVQQYNKKQYNHYLVSKIISLQNINVALLKTKDIFKIITQYSISHNYSKTNIKKEIEVIL